MTFNPLLGKYRCSRVQIVRGFTLFEFAVVVSIIGVLGAVLLSRIASYQEQAELMAMEQTLVSLRSALRLQVAYLQTSGRQAELPALAEQNPISWLVAPPVNYLGELPNDKNGKIPNGNWFFDKAEKKLIYSSNVEKELNNKQSSLLKFKVIIKTTGKLPGAGTAAVVLDQVGE